MLSEVVISCSHFGLSPTKTVTILQEVYPLILVLPYAILLTISNLIVVSSPHLIFFCLDISSVLSSVLF